MVKSEWQERHGSCKRRGAPSAQPRAHLLPKAAPKPCPSPGTEDEKEEMKEQEEGEARPRWEAAVPSAWGRCWAGAAAACQTAPPRGPWGHTPGRQGRESTACGRPVPASPGAQEQTPRRAQGPEVLGCPGAGWLSCELYPLEGFMVPQGHLWGMSRDCGPEGRRTAGPAFQERAVRPPERPETGCAQLPL